jgi:oligopeptide/dipeptide ABC transporter ATP-binding protein
VTEALFRIDGLVIEHEWAGERRRLVDGIEFVVRPGEIVGLVGESGSGKSLSMMASVGLAAPNLALSAGRVTFAGRSFPAADRSSLRANLAHGVSLLFQNAKGALNPFLTVERQVGRALSARLAAGERRRRITELLGAVGLDSDRTGPRYAHELSGGQAQRVAMACALATEPRLLIADEPTTALDVTTQREVLEYLVRLGRERELAVVLVSHNLALVALYCGRAYVMHAGHVVESGPVDLLFSRPLHPYTQGLIAAIPDVDRPRELVPLEGSVWGGGFAYDQCRFSHRCPHVRGECLAAKPTMREAAHRDVRCVLYGAEAA